MLKKYGLPAIITVLLAGIYYYLAVPSLNIKSAALWGFILFIVIAYIVLVGIVSGTLIISDLIRGKKFLNEENYNAPVFFKKKTFKTIVLSVIAVIIVGVCLIFFSSSQIFNASEYQQMLTVKEANFNEDIAELPLSKIPVVDRDTAERLGSRKIGEVVELVSQFNVSNYYTQINYQNTPVRVSPLEYADIVKWFTNKDEGIPYYVKIDMATQDTELVELKSGMKYAPCEYFSRDLMRHVMFKYPTKMIDSVSFEISENGTPYWIISCYDYTIGFLGGYDITSIVTVNACSGEMSEYDVSSVPTWIDCVYKANVVLTQANYWGAYKNGYLNSIVSQKGVVKTTEGYNYLAINDDIWAYTGITSVVADESNIGFILVNLRTKEAKTFAINGAEEYSAMESAQGKVQEKAYSATFPILVNIADTPSYFISLKDNAGLVKAYSFVSVANYQIVGVGDTLAAAEAEYRRLLQETGKLQNGEGSNPSGSSTTEGSVEKISSAVVSGNTCYYIKLLNDQNIYIVNVSLNDGLPFVKVGDNLKIAYDKNTDTINVISVEIK